jgi:hypothetical protein
LGKDKMKKKIREELLKKLKMCGNNTDKEQAHKDAENILLLLCNDKTVITIWNKIKSDFYYI